MKILAKSASLLNSKQVREHILKCCPCRLFKNVNLVDCEGQLNYCYRLPSKAKLDLSIYSPVTDDLFNYLIDSELRLDELGDQQFCIQSIRDLQNQANIAIKEFCSTLTPEQCERYSSKINTLKDCINNDCVPHVTRTINTQWNDTIRTPLFKSIKPVEL